MSERHSVRAQAGPGLMRVVAGYGATVLVSVGACWSLGPQPVDVHGATGFVLGIGLAVSLARTTFGWMTERELAGRRRDREVERARKRAKRDRENTGTWVKGDLELVVRWDEETRLYWVSGHVEGVPGRRVGAPWYDLDVLAGHLIAIEGEGWTAGDDVGTRQVRAALDLPGWDVVPGQVMDLVLEQKPIDSVPWAALAAEDSDVRGKPYGEPLTGGTSGTSPEQGE